MFHYFLTGNGILIADTECFFEQSSTVHRNTGIHQCADLIILCGINVFGIICDAPDTVRHCLIMVVAESYFSVYHENGIIL